METHPSILAWRTTWTEEPGRLQLIGSQRVGHDLVTEQQHPGISLILQMLTGLFLTTHSTSDTVTGF